MAINRAQLAKELAPGLNALFGMEYSRYENEHAEIFDQVGQLENLEAFASHNGPDFYGLPRNPDQITLSKKSWEVPSYYTFGNDSLVPIRAGELVNWTVTG